MTQRQIDLSQDRYYIALDDSTEIKLFKRWGEMYVTLSYKNSRATLPLTKLLLLEDKFDIIKLAADFLKGSVGMESHDLSCHVDQSETS